MTFGAKFLAHIAFSESIKKQAKNKMAITFFKNPKVRKSG
jgi:hypothetical protein